VVVGVVCVYQVVLRPGPWNRGDKEAADLATVVVCGAVKAELDRTMHIVIGQAGVAVVLKCGVTVHACVFVVHLVTAHSQGSLVE
tara:strand:+ start:7588 stop:7842 length:255 start_codon:yes stop_codon:yes gene_type:complete